MGLTKEYLDKIPRGITSKLIAHDTQEPSHLGPACLPSYRRQLELWILFGANLQARDAGCSSLLDCDNLVTVRGVDLGPDSVIEVVGVPKVGVRPAQAGVVLNDVVLDQVVEVGGVAVACGGRQQSGVPGPDDEVRGKVDGRGESVLQLGEGQVETVPGNVAVVCQCVEHWTG